MKTLSVYAIIKDEEEMLEDALKSAVGADEIVVCIDDRTTDKSREIALKYTDKVFDYKWDEDFSKAKNEACSRCHGDFVVSLDGDCRFGEGEITKIKAMIQNTSRNAIFTELHSLQFPGYFHRRAKIYRNNGEIFYKGRAHEDLNVIGEVHESGYLPKIYYGFSGNHAKDPERYVRIMKKALEEEPDNPRYMFYYASSLFDKKRYREAIEVFLKYVGVSQYLAEKADAYHKLAQCHWYLNEGKKAREMCFEAVKLNPDFSAALRFLAHIHDEPWKSKWRKIAENATDDDVLFRSKK